MVYGNKEHRKRQSNSIRLSLSKRTEEQRILWKQGLSNSIKGRIPWNKGLKGHPSCLAGAKKTVLKRDEKWKQNVQKATQNPKRNKKISEARTGMKFSMETKEKIRLATLKQHGRKKLRHATNLELMMIIYLERNKIPYEFQSIINNEMVVDFLIKSKNRVIEVDGPWHQKDKDIYRDKRLKELGYQIIRIKGRDEMSKLLGE